jgi:integrase
MQVATIVLAVSSTCRSVELKHLRWRDVNFLDGEMTIARSKTEAGHRLIPLNSDATAALARLKERADADGTSEPGDYVFLACERGIIDRTRPQKSWRTAWRHWRRQLPGKLVETQPGPFWNIAEASARPNPVGNWRRSRFVGYGSMTSVIKR